jgi:hypothetical protein
VRECGVCEKFEEEGESGGGVEVVGRMKLYGVEGES